MVSGITSKQSYREQKPFSKQLCLSAADLVAYDVSVCIAHKTLSITLQ
jgi:hypothetical protein